LIKLNSKQHYKFTLQNLWSSVVNVFCRFTSNTAFKYFEQVFRRKSLFYFLGVDIMVLDLLRSATVSHLRLFHTGRCEAIMELSSSRSHRANVLKPAILKIIIPAGGDELIQFGRLKCPTDLSSDIAEPRQLDPQKLSSKLIKRILTCMPLSNKDEYTLLEKLSRRLGSTMGS
ncbi:MAG: hypothetical protein VKK59_05685, partial [Vampirovibrionales bacterium]|nr:hypothetical protein [Vampirovibrionales bacterium]